MNLKNPNVISSSIQLAMSVALVTAVPTTSFAGTTQPLSFLDSMTRLKQAVDTVENEASVRPALKNNGLHALSVSQRIKGAEIETTKFQHYYKGLEVLGSMVFHHRSDAKTTVRNYMAEFDLDAKPAVSEENAVALAKAFIGDRELNTRPALKVLPSDDRTSANLVYMVELTDKGLNEGHTLIVNANSGEMMADLSNFQTIAPISIYSAKGTGKEVDASSISDAEFEKLAATECQLLDASTGGPLAVNPSKCNRAKNGDAASDDSTSRAERNTQLVLNYYMDNHGRNSFDDQGSETVSVVHIGKGYNNAAWIVNQNVMVYGDGDGQRYSDFTQGVDVAGHEMTHGVTSHTAQLMMKGQSGALSEAYSDFFGKMIADDGDWIVGKELFVNHAAAGIRDLQNPGSLNYTGRNSSGQRVKKPFPAHMKNIETSGTTCDATNDRCWVHANATIPGHASYLVYSALGREMTQKLYYHVLTQRLTSQMNFQEAAKETIQGCSDLGYSSSSCDQVKKAFADVGL